MISVEHVSRIYGKKTTAFAALKDVSFEIPDGKTVAIIGKSGSGKSTLMHLLGGLEQPSDGSIVINGKNLTTLNRQAMDKFRARDLGFVFQSFFVEGGQTCYQNVLLPLEIGEIPAGRRRQLVEEALSQVDLADKLNTKAANLSGGQKQRLAIARAIVTSPQVILADEPTGNLDSATGDKIMDLLFGLHKQLGTTLVIVTHDPDLAARCDVRVELRDGEVVGMRSRGKKS